MTTPSTMQTYRIHRVRWDTDGLPVEELATEFPSVTVSVSDPHCEWEAEQLLSDWLSDETGFCHFGFEYELVENG
jgi:hypothetical protein